MSSLSGKVVIITGSSSGIGAATAVYFAERGAKLSLAARNPDNLNKVAQECRSKGLADKDVLAVPCDVTVEKDVERLVSSTIKQFGRLDVLVNNAGKNKYVSILDAKLEDLDAIMKTNVRAPFHVTQLCLPYLIKTKGCVVNVSSNTAQRAFPIAICYCMSKAAFDHFTRTISVEFAPQGVRVNSVNPGMTRTDFQLNSGMTKEEYKVYLDRQKELQPLCGAVEPTEVAKAIAFFASDDSGSITGESLFIDGGRHAMAPI